MSLSNFPITSCACSWAIGSINSTDHCRIRGVRRCWSSANTKISSASRSESSHRAITPSNEGLHLPSIFDQSSSTEVFTCSPAVSIRLKWVMTASLPTALLEVTPDFRSRRHSVGFLALGSGENWARTKRGIQWCLFALPDIAADLYPRMRPPKPGYRAAVHLYLAGINHNDPGQRDTLVGWLRQTMASEGGADVSFVAAEWAKAAHERVVGSRANSQRQAQEAWGDRGRPIMASLARTMGFEADAHREIWPDLDPIWLEDGRVMDAKAKFNLDMYAEGRFGIYNGWLGGQVPEGDVADVLEALGKRANKETRRWETPAETDPGRTSFATRFVSMPVERGPSSSPGMSISRTSPARFDLDSPTSARVSSWSQPVAF